VKRGARPLRFGIDAGDVLARDHRWRMSASAWIRVFQECLENPGPSQLVRAAVSFDFRHVMGGLNLVSPLVGILQTARRYPDFLRRLARTATDWRPPLDFLGKDFGCAVGKGRAGGSTSKAGRNRTAREPGALSTPSRMGSRSLQPSTAWWPPRRSAVSSGRLRRPCGRRFTIVCDIRLERHAACIKAGRTPDNLIDPKSCGRWSGPPCVRSFW